MVLRDAKRIYFDKKNGNITFAVFPDKIKYIMKKKIIAIEGFLLVFACPSLFSEISINEISTGNLSAYMEKDNYNFSDYIELQTEGDSVNLNEYLFIHYGKRKIKGNMEEKWRWRIDKEIMVGPHSVIWMDETQTKGHAPYKLDADGGSICIYHNGEFVDSLSYPAMGQNLSYGYAEGQLGFMEPTPYRANTQAYEDYRSARCPLPRFSHPGGILSDSIELSIEGDTMGAIYYTLDGSEPTPLNGIPYEKPIPIGNTTNLRAKQFQEGKLPSLTATSTFLFEDEAHKQNGGFTIPIISITVDSSYFYDDTIGMCVVGKNGVYGEKSCTRAKANYNREWDRPVHLDYIVNGEIVLSQDVEVAVEGGCSRTEKIKSLSLKTSKKTEVDTFSYHFFKSKPNITHRRIHLRNGGTAYDKVRFRDGLMQTFAIGMNIDYQAFQPVAYYVNGKYQGFMDLNERTNADYIDANYGIEEEDIDLISLSDQIGINVSKGDQKAYDRLVDLVSPYSYKASKDSIILYEGACKLMDMDEYIDYQIFQQFIVNTDWPGNNTKLWRKRKNGKFRWILFDTDFGLGLPSYEYLGGASKNMISWCSGTGSLQWANKQEWMVEIFQGLYQNPFFKRKFVTKYLMHLSSTFSPERIEAVFDSITGLVDAEYRATFNTSAVNETSSMRKFALDRHKYLYKQLQNYVKGKDTINIEVCSDHADAELFMNGIQLSHYKGKYFTGYSLELKAIPPQGYEFAGWELSPQENISRLSDTTDSRYGIPKLLIATFRGQGKITAKFRPKSATIQPDTLPTLVINEICTSNDQESKNPDALREYPDWIEIYNYGEKSIDLAGYTLSIRDSDTVLASTKIPEQFTHTIIGPKGHKIIWAKGDSSVGALYMDFTLDKDSLRTICLSKGDSLLVDSIKYPFMEPNESYGRESDGAETWTIFTTDPLELNPSPGKKNGVKDTVGVKDYANDPLTLWIYPNPAKEVVTISTTEMMEQIIVYDMTGRVIYRREGIESQECSIDTSSWDKGLYIVKAITKGQIKIAELIKGGS